MREARRLLVVQCATSNHFFGPPSTARPVAAAVRARARHPLAARLREIPAREALADCGACIGRGPIPGVRIRILFRRYRVRTWWRCIFQGHQKETAPNCEQKGAKEHHHRHGLAGSWHLQRRRDAPPTPRRWVLPSPSPLRSLVSLDAAAAAAGAVSCGRPSVESEILCTRT